jgi:uncharacterized protein YndB with AHSA1/START domain
MNRRNIAALAVTLPSELEIVMTRSFDAPPRVVFDAWTKPKHLRHWFGCRRSTLLACDIDLRVCGAYRFVLSGEDGRVHTMRGVYREIIAPSRLVFTQRHGAEGFESGEAVVNLTFEQRDGHTLFTSRILHSSREDRDIQLSTGMERGWAEIFDHLEEHLAGGGWRKAS